MQNWSSLSYAINNQNFFNVNFKKEKLIFITRFIFKLFIVTRSVKSERHINLVKSFGIRIRFRYPSLWEAWISRPHRDRKNKWRKYMFVASYTMIKDALVSLFFVHNLFENHEPFYFWSLKSDRHVWSIVPFIWFSLDEIIWNEDKLGFHTWRSNFF